MFLTRLKAGAVVLLALCAMSSLTALATEPAQAGRDDGGPIAALAAVAGGDTGPSQAPAAGAAARAEKPPEAGGDGGVRGKGRMFTPDGKLVFVNVYSNDTDADQKELVNFANVSVMPRLGRTKGMDVLRNLANRIAAMRIRLDPDRMRAHGLSSEDIMKALAPSTMIRPDERLDEGLGKVFPLKANELILIWRFNKPEQYENIVLKASPNGEILRLKDVGRVELAFDIAPVSSDVDGHPSAAFVLKQAPGSNAAEFIEAIKGELERTKKESFSPGMDFEVIPPDSRDMIHAVIEAPRGSTLEYTSAKCQELSAIARGIDEITSVTTLAGYHIRTERRGPGAGTCLIRLKDRSDRKRTSRRIIETLEEECRAVNAHLEFFEPPAVSVFVAAGGFSVRVLDGTSSLGDGRPGTFMDDLLKRKKLEGLFTSLAGHYPQYELVIDNDAAMRKGISVADAMENLPVFAGGDVQAEPTFRRLSEGLSNLFVKSDRGEMVPYSAFLQLKKKQGLSEIDR